MITVIAKAQPVTGEISDETIEINGSLPEFVNLDEAAVVYDIEADMLFNVLCRSLPGGVIDRLAAKLLLLKASMLVIPHIGGDG